ncbi:formylglycine-generating enzyme family protein [Bacillus chungangensis]|uniref:Formylglycine-generating enzyme required for sulfatase activity n=1 Tax=Bacillus chungangensis TaxID=587633 RepID=A0ABT9WW15_9BACI|nr:SUMF1/EgtB/PvdO family nonheme iron enzyme [Bacillus chungangensis]MDQ0177489.1 formylglycine-generating enzyme required for sulfatase activity [Bacillus chungangensis]
MDHFNFIHIPEGYVFVGSTMNQIERAYNDWKDRLLKDEYKAHFKDWLMKEYPMHQVFVPEFQISETLVTNDVYEQYCNEVNDKKPESLKNKELGGGPNHPVWGVSMEEAIAFTKWLSNKLQKKVSIPTEAQWEYAARGNTKREYPWGEGFSHLKCNSIESKINTTTPVKKYESGRSYFGLYDMAGNVEEWVLSTYQPYPNGEFIKDDLIEALGEDYFVLKGGSFARGGDLCRISRRHGRHPDDVFRFTGFRLVLNY